jgi:hypothetical protein
VLQLIDSLMGALVVAKMSESVKGEGGDVEAAVAAAAAASANDDDDKGKSSSSAAAEAEPDSPGVGSEDDGGAADGSDEDYEGEKKSKKKSKKSKKKSKSSAADSDEDSAPKKKAGTKRKKGDGVEPPKKPKTAFIFFSNVCARRTHHRLSPFPPSLPPSSPSLHVAGSQATRKKVKEDNENLSFGQVGKV